jgi:hypothetical protein
VAIGSAGWAGVLGVTARRLAGWPAPPVESTMEPHSPHSGQRPTHLGGRCPQASHS